VHKKTRVYFVLHLLLLARRHGPVGVAQRVAVRAWPPPAPPRRAGARRPGAGGGVGRTRACREFSPACAVLPLSTLCSDTPLSDHTRVFLSRLYVSRPRPRPRAAAAAAAAARNLRAAFFAAEKRPKRERPGSRRAPRPRPGVAPRARHCGIYRPAPRRAAARSGVAEHPAPTPGGRSRPLRPPRAGRLGL
jgi:hypothetical protein